MILNKEQAVAIFNAMFATEHLNSVTTIHLPACKGHDIIRAGCSARGVKIVEGMFTTQCEVYSDLAAFAKAYGL